MADIFARMRNLIGSSAEWVANNLILGLGEFGVERSGANVILKMGDGLTTYSALPFITMTPSGVDPNVTALQGSKADKATAINTGGGLTGGGNLSATRTLSIAATSNGYGNRTISAAQPTGGADGDIWYVI